MIKEIVQNILVYVVMVTVLKGLISDQGFLEIFRFVSGMILILLFISPVISVFTNQTNWYEKLEKNILKVDKAQIEQELSIAEGSFEKVLLEECEQEIGQQVKTIVKEEGYLVNELKVTVQREDNGDVQVQQIRLSVKEQAKQANIRKDEGTENGTEKVKKIEKIQIDAISGEEDGVGGEQKKKDRKTGLLQKKICKEFSLPEEAVEVWRSSGKNG